MLTPVPMVRVELLALDRDLVAVSRCLGGMGVLHPVDVRQLGDWPERFSWGEMEELADSFDTLCRRLDRIREALGIPRVDGLIGTRISPDESLRDASELVDGLEPQVRRIDERSRDLQARALRLDLLEGQLRMMTDLQVDLNLLRGLSFLHMVSGLVPAERLERLGESLRDTPHALVPVQRTEGRILVFAFSSRGDAEVLDRALQSAYVERVAIAEELRGTPARARTQLQARRSALEEEAHQLDGDREALRGQWLEELSRVQRTLDTNARVVELWRCMGRTERTRSLVGWVPRARLELFANEVAATTGGRSVLATAEPSPLDDATGVQPPTALSNPGPLRPFEELTRTFGLLGYWDLDPTPLAGPLFLLLFGLMFGDLGQGAVLVLVGLALSMGRIAEGYQSFGRILAGCGLSAMLFGLLYGSFFGTEALIPALWLHPLENPLLVIGVAVVLGAFVVTMGLLFGTITAWRRRDLVGFYLGQSGLAGLWLYLGLLATAVLVAAGGGGLVLAALVPLVLVPLGIIFLHGPIAHALGWAESVEDGTYFIQSGVETIDLAIRFASNTVSFLRVGAFALAHVGLGVTVLALAELVRGLPVASVVIIVLGNVVILLLEGLVVGIQALRLEYYEFFTKFLRGGGTAYAPFALHATDARYERARREV